jgi:hypothetical protein
MSNNKEGIMDPLKGLYSIQLTKYGTLVVLAFNLHSNLPGPIPENQREVLISTLFVKKKNSMPRHSLFKWDSTME